MCYSTNRPHPTLCTLMYINFQGSARTCNINQQISVAERSLHIAIMFTTHFACIHRRQDLKGGVSTKRRGATLFSTNPGEQTRLLYCSCLHDTFRCCRQFTFLPKKTEAYRYPCDPTPSPTRVLLEDHIRRGYFPSRRMQRGTSPTALSMNNIAAVPHSSANTSWKK